MKNYVSDEVTTKDFLPNFSVTITSTIAHVINKARQSIEK